MKGDLSKTIEGIIASKEQINMEAKLKLKGYILATDEASDKSVVTSNSVSGDLSVTFHGYNNPFLAKPVEVLSLKEL